MSFAERSCMLPAQVVLQSVAGFRRQLSEPPQSRFLNLDANADQVAILHQIVPLPHVCDLLQRVEQVGQLVVHLLEKLLQVVLGLVCGIDAHPETSMFMIGPVILMVRPLLSRNSNSVMANLLGSSMCLEPSVSSQRVDWTCSEAVSIWCWMDFIICPARASVWAASTSASMWTLFLATVLLLVLIGIHDSCGLQLVRE